MPSPRPSTARVAARPCPICGKLALTDGRETWCHDGIGHALERELGLRRRKEKVKP